MEDMAKTKLLVVDDDESIRTQMKWALLEDYDVFLAHDGGDAVRLMKREYPLLVTLDLGLPPNPMETEEGFRLLKEILRHDPMVKVIVVTGNPEKGAALQAISEGAHDFFTKPIDIEELKVTLRRASYVTALEQECRSLQGRVQQGDLGGMIGASSRMQEVFTAVRKVATTDVPVLLVGDSGTGKELIARAIHDLSDRRDAPFVAINCGAIPEGLIESELFGHEKGAFTGAYYQKKGKFEIADGGTIFLDEIGELAPQLQVKILRFLQDHTIERVGGMAEVSLNVRVISATNRDLQHAISHELFREDLYYRLGVITISLPPLRERGEDIVLIATAFLGRAAMEYGKKFRGFAHEALAAMKTYEWPGNVREMENRIKRAVIMAEGEFISSGDLRLFPETGVGSSLDLNDAKERLERDYVSSALARHDWNMARAARELGVSRQHLYDMAKKYGIRRRAD